MKPNAILLVLLVLLLLFMTDLMAQGMVEGRITDEETAKPLSLVNISIEGTRYGTTTDRDGKFTLALPAGHYRIQARYMGYKPRTGELTIENSQTQTWDVSLTPTPFSYEEIVITSTKTGRAVNEIPARATVLTEKTLQSLPVLSADDALQYVSGLSVSRSLGILSSRSTVSLRGMGSEQGRTLILLDGVPINKADGGTVNWNLINPAVLEKIEISKGAGSSLYGSNAMGGVIHLFSKRPTEPFSAVATTEYGSMNTASTRLLLRSAVNHWQFQLNGMARTSDGFIADTNEVDTSYHKIRSDLREHQLGGSVGYAINANHRLEASALYYRGIRGTGRLYTMGTPKGTRNNYTNTLYSLRYEGLFGLWKWQTSFYALHENYQDINESFRNTYRRYDVESLRDDRGIHFFISRPLGNGHLLSAGLEYKYGAVDAVDDYKTSSDAVYNQGKMRIGAVFLQEEWTLMNNRLRLTGNVRLDQAKFYDGVFRIDSATSITNFMRNYQDTMVSTTWRAFSSKLAAQYSPSEMIRIYALYGHGFRPPILDDMCRSGRFSKGFKILNPQLKPESIDNFETGFDLKPFDRLLVSVSGYHSVGRDYIAFISTGDSIAYSQTNRRPIFRKDNISRVTIRGIEADIQFHAHRRITLFTNYTFIATRITEFAIHNPAVDTDLKNKQLTDIPRHQFNLGLNASYRWFALYSVYRYKGKQWYDDLNTQSVKPYATIDARLSATVHNRYILALSVQNLLDKKYIDNRGVPSPGRWIFGELTIRY